MNNSLSPTGYPEYLDGPDRGEYGVAFLAAVPLWAWLTAGGAAAAAGTYVYGKGSGSEEAAQRAAAAQAAAGAAPGTYYPIYPAAPGLPADPSKVTPQEEPWYRDPRYLFGTAIVLTALVIGFRATRRSSPQVVEQEE
jgi:hypothetical protein